MTDAEVLFENRGNIGLITLNRAKAINSLTEGMCLAIRNQLEAWRVSPSVKAVVVVGAGEKAFCAGGDVVKVTKSYQVALRTGAVFFREEYLMNIAIDAFPIERRNFVEITLHQDRCPKLIAAVGEHLNAHVVQQRRQEPTMRWGIGEAGKIKVRAMLQMQRVGVVQRTVELFARGRLDDLA